MANKKQTNPTKTRKSSGVITGALYKRICFLALGLCAVALAVALVVMGSQYLIPEDQDDGKILPNVYAAGINLGGMSREDAGNALRLQIGTGFSTQSMVVKLPDAQLVLEPQYTQASVNIESVLDAAFRYGRSGTRLENQFTRLQAEKQDFVVPLLNHMHLDWEYIRQAVTDFCHSYSSTMTQSTVALNGTRPDYRAIIADGIPLSSVKHQTMVITMGTPEFTLEADRLYNAVLDAYSLYNMSFNYAAPVVTEPEKLNVQALFDAFCILPEDAHMDADTFEITPEEYGYGFNVEEVTKLINRAEYGSTITVTLDFIFPDITEKDLKVNYFQHVLSSYTSSSDGKIDADRDTNLQLACKAIDSIIIKSGESFDFNAIVGLRTTNAGYKEAPTYPGSTTKTVGGGVDQIASALRYCAMMAGLKVDTYYTHKFAVPYTPLGTDACVSSGSQNLVFTNTSSKPIQIFVTTGSGTVTVRIVGTLEGSYVYRIEQQIKETLEPKTKYQQMIQDNVYGYEDGQVLEEGITGYVVDVYLCRVNPRTGAVVSSELLETCTYACQDELIIQIISETTET